MKTILPRLVLSVWSVAASLTGAAQQNVRTTLEEYVERYKHIAIAHQQQYGIPASITLAQGILESDCGNGRLAVAGNNHFGIKCKRDWTGATILHDDDALQECFRSYASAEESYDDHARYLDTQPRYDSLFAYGPTDYLSWARGLKACGYATDPRYAQKLVRIIEENKLYVLDREPALLADGDAAMRVEEHPSRAAQTSIASEGVIDVDNFRVAINDRRGYPVYRNNGVDYVLAREGDTWQGLAAALSLPERRLRRFNDAAAHAEPRAGEMIYIRSKRPAAIGSTLYHTVSAGETLRGISQRYGIRLARLRGLNGLSREARLSQGQHLKLR